MAKRKPAKPVPLTRAGRALRNPPPASGEGRRPLIDKAASFAMPGPAERDVRQAALHSALAKFVARKGIGAVETAPATGSEIRDDLTTASDGTSVSDPQSRDQNGSGPDLGEAACLSNCKARKSNSQVDPSSEVAAVSAFAPSNAVEKTDMARVDAASTPRRRGPSRKATDTKLGAAIGAALGAPLVRKKNRPTFKKRAAQGHAKVSGPIVTFAKVDGKPPRFTFPPYVPPTPAPQPEIGAFRVEQLGMNQCRFACTADDVPRGQHRFCGAPTEIGPGNQWGSWCSKHLAQVFSDTSTMARPAFLKNAERSGNR